MKKTFALVIIAAVCVLSVSAAVCVFAANSTASGEEYKTVSEIGNPTIAGASYYDDGTLYYSDAGSTVGYQLDQSNTVLDFDLIFNRLEFPSWFSLTLKADGFDRTQSPNLNQKGYSFVIFPAGTVQVWKNGLTLADTAMSAVNVGEKYNIKLGAVNVGSSVRLILRVNGQSVVDVTDSDGAYLGGNWFNICADGPSVNAEIISTKQEIYPDYHTYTLSTLKRYPLIANPEYAKADKYNNLEILGSGATVGFNQALRNFSLETKVRFTSFNFPANFYIGVRVGGFDRVMSPNLDNKGYSFRISAGGTVEVYKQTESLGSASFGSAFEPNKDYVLEVGSVDVSDDSTNLFVKINNRVVVSLFDSDNPLQNGGWININGDGDVACKLTSSNTDVNPLMTAYSQDADYHIYSVRFQNPVSYEAMDYAAFGERNLKAIMLNGESVLNLNKIYYALTGGNRVNAVDLSFAGNTLTIRVAKKVYSAANGQAADFAVASITVKKTSASGGLSCPSGFVLKNQYDYLVR